MMNRNLVPMTQLIERISMGPFGSDIKTECFVNAGVPVLNGGNLTTIRMNDDSFNFVTKEKANSLSKSIARRGDIVVTHRGTLGQLSYIPEDSQYEEYLISQSQFCVTLNTDLVDPIYFAYYFHSSEGQKRLLSFANYVGVPPLASATTNFKNLEFPLISLGEQKEIVNKILCIENKIRNNTSICSDLESMAKLLYDYWFMQFDFPDENGRPYKSSGGKMVWNEELKREIPEGWKVSRIGDLCKISRGVSYTTANLKSDGTPIISLASINRKGEYIPEGIKYYSGKYDESKVLKPYDAIMCNTDMTQEKEIVAKIILVPDIFGESPILSTHHISHLIFDDEIYKVYVCLTTQTKWFHNHIKGFSSGTNVLGLDSDGFKNLRLLIPTNDVLTKFNKIIMDNEKCKSNLITENQELASLRDFLLPMLMNGQIKIEDVKAS